MRRAASSVHLQEHLILDRIKVDHIALSGNHKYSPVGAQCFTPFEPEKLGRTLCIRFVIE